MRTKKIFLNMICDILPYLIIGVIGIVKMDVLINYIGDVGNGYYQTINQIISYVFLAQMGFSEAVTYSLYKPFADKNKDNINAIYGGARKVFRIIAFVILGIICLVTLGLYLFYHFEEGYKAIRFNMLLHNLNIIPNIIFWKRSNISSRIMCCPRKICIFPSIQWRKNTM